MKVRAHLVAAVAAAALVSLVPGADASAHGHRGHGGRVSVGIGYGYGYPGFYRPFGYYGYYGGYYPGSYLGFGVYPRFRPRRNRDQGTVRNEALYVYPANGQSEQQLADDRYDCHVWSVDSTGFDPTEGAGSRKDADNYARAFTACMEGRDYVVR